MSDADAQLDALRAALLSNRPRAFTPEEGAAAFQAHKLLASDVHRAAKLNRRGSDGSETEEFVRYVAEHFPDGRNGKADARLLWTDWRTSMLKESTPGPLIAVTHGQAHAHWYREPDGRLCLNLEDMWDDYAESVEDFIDGLRADAERRKVVLERWRKTTVDVRQLLRPVGGAPAVGATAVSASVGDAFTVFKPPPE